MATGSLHINRDIILATKRHHMGERRRSIPMDAALSLAQMQRKPRHILNMMQDDDRVALIGQITRTEMYDPVSAALTYAREGADAVLFFTDHSIYAGDLDDMLIVARGVKDTAVIYGNYIVDEYSVISARAADASALILHGSLLDPATLRRVVGATQRAKMSAILQVESHDTLELAASLSPHAVAFGDELSHNVERSLQNLIMVRNEIPTHTRVFLMHTLETLDEVEAALQARVHAIIVGDVLLKNEKKIARVRELIGHPMAR
jgi:indole-3-glycerol phosphate synthase